jgi:hypothetical protein
MARKPLEQGGVGPYHRRYTESIRVFTVFFAAVLGFGLKRLLDQGPPSYKWLFFLVATFIFLRFLTSAANHLWLEYQRDDRDYGFLDDLFVMVLFSWLTVFGVLGAYLCYADKPPQFFWRATILLIAAFAASVIQVGWFGGTWIWKKIKQGGQRERQTGQWVWGWFVGNTFQLACVVVLMKGCFGGTWGARLVFLAIISAFVLICDFYWQLSQLTRPRPAAESESRRSS